jgi:hypothetical protein
MFDHLDDPLEFTPTREFRAAVLDRGRRIRARRRLTATAAAAAVLASALTAVVALTSLGADQEGSVVRTDVTTTTPPVVVTARTPRLPKSKLVTEGDGLSLAPATGLHDDQIIDVRIDSVDPGTTHSGTIATCASEVLDHLDTAHIDPRSTMCVVAGVSMNDHAPLPVQRYVRTPAGVVDCAEARGRCIVAFNEGGVPLRYAPLAFVRTGTRATASVSVSGLGGQLKDGTTIHLTMAGFAPGAAIRIAECLDVPADVGVPGLWTIPPKQCDQRGSRNNVMVDDSGAAAADFTVYHDILATREEAKAPRWRTCSTCVLVVDDRRSKVTVPLSIAATSRPIHPRIRIASPGPYRPGQRVTITGTGFQPGDSPGFDIGWCLTEPMAPGTADEAPNATVDRSCTRVDKGEPRSEVKSPMVTTGEVIRFGYGFVVDGEGGFTIHDFPLPAADRWAPAAVCTEAPGECSVAWFTVNRLPPNDQRLPLDLTG